MDDEYLTTAEVARCVGARPVTIRKWCLKGWFPRAQRRGRDWIIPASDLLCWHRRPPGRKPAQ